MPLPAPEARPPTDPPGIARTAALRAAPLVALAATLAGCAEGGTAIGPGGLSAPFRGALVNDEQHFQCEESYDPATGQVTIKVVHDRGSHVDDTAIHEIAGVAGAAVAGAKAAAPVVGAMGARGRPDPVPPPLNFPACFGTQSLGYAPSAPPNPTPPYPASASAGRPAMLEAPDPDGSPDAALQQRVRRAGGSS